MRVAWNKGIKMSDEFREKCRQRVSNRLGKKQTAKTKRKMSLSHIGIKHTEETKQKLSNIFFGRIKVNTAKRTYMRIHRWLNRIYKDVVQCENNCTNTSFRLEWARKHDKPHAFDRDNYRRLCVKCHREYDIVSDIVKKKMSISATKAWIIRKQQACT